MRTGIIQYNAYVFIGRVDVGFIIANKFILIDKRTQEVFTNLYYVLPKNYESN